MGGTLIAIGLLAAICLFLGRGSASSGLDQVVSTPARDTVSGRNGLDWLLALVIGGGLFLACNQ